ncbi:hypothetical protein [Roseateles oligotrophus]|uniref:Uncharacterized protein n=1 Tax=Roseateles oligotrophus TaxID=1769250 RepID=A0ABT2YJ03_9BURK|nr:hypothetical protein [Roseateles oligotrophus]MCV2370020.1 hypothetical protein [Roseateles oligotrophus]
MGLKNDPLVSPGAALAFTCLSLALLASSISVSIAAAAGWQRGGTDEQKILLAGVGVVAVLGAHLLLALCRQASALVRVLGFALWLICGAFVAYVHAGYFLGAQDQAGVRRAATVVPLQQVALVEPRRALSAVLEELAKVKGLQAGLARNSCLEGCSAHKAREVFLIARGQALEVEAEEVRRWQDAKVRLDQRKTFLLDDPVTSRLAAGLGMETGVVSLVTGILFSVILEGLGCLCWYLVLLRHDSTLTGSVMPAGSDPIEVVGVHEALAVQPRAELDLLAAKVKSEIEEGRVQLTVKGIREYLGCGQGKASEVRRILGQDSSVSISALDPGS